jgi:hypothetical protein
MLFILSLSAVVAAQETKPKSEHYSGVGMLPRSAARTASQIDIRFKRYSTDAEAQELAQVLFSGGGDALRKALEKRKSIGSIALSRRVSQFQFKLIRSRPIEGGRRVIAVSDRPIQFAEAYNSGRSMDYNVGVLILDLKKNEKGKEVGEGTLIYGADITIKDKTVEVEHMAIDPIRLTNVRKY